MGNRFQCNYFVSMISMTVEPERIQFFFSPVFFRLHSSIQFLANGIFYTMGHILAFFRQFRELICLKF